MRRQQGQKGPTQRQLRVGEIIRHAFADMLMRSEIADPAFDGHNVTITEVRVSPDLRNATVYALPFGSDNADALKAALLRHQRYLRGELAKRIDLKYVPTLSFEIDETYENAQRVDAILRSPEVRRDLD